MIVNPNTFDPTITEEEVYQLINTLPIGYLGLAQQMHYWGRLFGVVTGEFSQEQDWDNFVVNRCLRDSIWATLRSVVDESENFLGFNLTRRFHNVVLSSFMFGENIRVMPAIESVNFVPVHTDLNMNAVSVSPFVVEGITAQLDGSRYYVLLPDDVVFNPNEVLLRRASDLGTYAIDLTRRPVKVGSDWKIYLDNHPIPYDGVSLINVQSTKYVFVDITPPIITSGIVVPTYVGTTQHIPQARPVQVLGNGDHRYWFYIYTLVDPAFYDSPVSLLDAEYYKLLPIIAFQKYTEEETFGELVALCDCCRDCGEPNRHFRVSANIVNARRGVVSIIIEGELFDDDEDGIYERFDTGCTDCFSNAFCDSCQYELRFPYITNPIYLDEKLQLALSQINQAVLKRTAAELPLVDCGCWLYPEGERHGFIARQQETFGTSSTNAFTGTTSISYQYGDLRGQKAYAEMMSKVPRVKYVYV